MYYERNMNMNVFYLHSFPVDDASGHYTTGIFYGNNYWIGSLSLCNTIYKANYKQLESSGKCLLQFEERLKYRLWNLLWNFHQILQLELVILAKKIYHSTICTIQHCRFHMKIHHSLQDFLY